MAPAPKIGDTVADFRLSGGHLAGGTFHRRDYTLCEQRGKPLTLAFYPGDDTPVCTAQLCSYSDGLAQLQGTGLHCHRPPALEARHRRRRHLPACRHPDCPPRRTGCLNTRTTAAASVTPP
ncbi:redoxin domain-containing protein [Streptomyces sp. NPDC048387]|uniref:redoxin domain-containing protein n=1 Tax=Streptomyces sp. NPDC048387 TaxID=3365542 RepID=UPI00371441F5